MSNCRPVVDGKLAEDLAFRYFGLDRSYVSATSNDRVEELESFEDRNFLMKGRLPNEENCSEFVLKVLHHVKSAQTDVVISRCEVTVHLEKHGFVCPVPVRTLRGALAEFVRLPRESGIVSGEDEATKEQCLRKNTVFEDGDDHGSYRRHAVCLLKFIPGIIVKEGLKAGTPQLLEDIGRYAGRLNKCLQGCDAELVLSQCPVTDWDLRSIMKMEREISLLRLSEARSRLARDVISALRKFVEPLFGQFRAGVIHNDINDFNLLLRSETAGSVYAVIDFSDCLHSFLVCELATCMAFFSYRLPEPAQAILPVVRGYESELSLLPVERDTLFYWFAARLLLIAMLCSLQCQKDPGNSAYLLPDIEPSFEALEKVWSLGKEEVDKIWWGDPSEKAG